MKQFKPALFFFFSVLFLAGCTLHNPLRSEEEKSLTFQKETLEGKNFLSPAEESSGTANLLVESKALKEEKQVAGLATQAGQMEISLEKVLRHKLSQKYNLKEEEILILKEKQNENYAKGEWLMMGDLTGSWWLATKIGDQWHLVTEGKDLVSCQEIENYNFPLSMVPECFDQETQEIIVRK